ncbi:MAG: bacteriohemerythrin [Bacteroidetes bacterium]|jgi:hemerythrin|nr:bacteriohemerythrin [Bacteroidota bacterium]MCL5034184.1 bacteriohemerythrin [Bacteroidota bacterium]
MPLIEWNEKLSVNIRAIDDQHKKWINILNELHGAMKAGKGRDAVGNVLDELVEYTKVHFASEEKLMKSNGYPLFAGHKKLHEDMVKEVEILRSRYSSGAAGLTIEVMQFLKNWLSEHIIGTDKNYGPYLNGKGVH